MNRGPATRPSLLIISFSAIESDARVLKQVEMFREDFAVTTCGYGARPDGVIDHLRIPDGTRAAPRNPILIRARLYGAIHRRLPAVRAARALLRGRSFDVVLANEYETVPIALDVARDGVHADLHEYSSRLHEEVPAWHRRVAPYVRWIIRRYVRQASSATTVSEGLAREYEREFGIRAAVVRNAAPYADAQPHSTGSVIRLVHSGAGLRSRRLEDTIEAVLRTTSPVTLDLYLTRNHPDYVDELREMADGSGGRVTVHDPVAYRELAETLRSHDVGIHVLPAINFNNQWAMPNKIFDYIQARLGVIVGPSPEMRPFITRLGVGVAAEGFAVDDIVRVLDALSRAEVDAMKARSDTVAGDLSAEVESLPWRAAVESILTGHPNAPR